MKFFKIIVLLVPLVCNAVPHGKEHDYMLIAMPASGSTFLIKAFMKTLHTVGITSEIFNYAQSRLAEGQTIYPEYSSSFAYNISETLLLGEYEEVWLKSNFNFTKEVFFAFRVPFYEDKFQTFILYRHRKHTFPAAMHSTYDQFYESFMRAVHEREILQKIQLWLRGKNINYEQKQLAIHTIAYYQSLSDAHKLMIPVIDYEQLMLLSETDLYAYLETLIPQTLFSSDLVQYICQNRNLGIKELVIREKKYKRKCSEVFCQELINFIKQLDPAMQYWYLFE